MSQNTSWERDQDAKLSCLTPESSIFQPLYSASCDLGSLVFSGLPLILGTSRAGLQVPLVPWQIRVYVILQKATGFPLTFALHSPLEWLDYVHKVSDDKLSREGPARPELMSLMVLGVTSAVRAWGERYQQRAVVASKDSRHSRHRRCQCILHSSVSDPISTGAYSPPLTPGHPLLHETKDKLFWKKKNEKNCPKCGYKAKQTSLQLWLHSLHEVLRQPLYIQTARHVTALCPHWYWNWAVDALCRDWMDLKKRPLHTALEFHSWRDISP